MDALVFDSSDLEQTERFLNDSYAPMRIGSSTEQPRAHIDRVADSSATVDRVDLAFEMSYDIDPVGKICLGAIESGVIENRVDGWGAEETFGPGQVFFYSPPDRPYRGKIRNARYSFTMLDPAVLARLAGNGTGQPVRVLDPHPVTPEAGAQLRCTILHLRSVLAEPPSQGSALVRSTAVEYLAARVLSTFRTSLPIVSSDDRGAPSAAVRRAQAYIDEHAGSAIAAADIAAATNVSVRSLQYGFRRHLGTTPMNYLRRARLERVRAELSAADRYGNQTVTTIASRWGFLSASRFAAVYREAFGETPSRTLRS